MMRTPCEYDNAKKLKLTYRGPVLYLPTVQALFMLFLIILPVSNSLAQPLKTPQLFRIYEDNDFLNIRGNGTDNSYTNGTSLDYFYQQDRPSRLFINRWMPRTGHHSVNVFSWRLTQLMVSPNDISKTAFQPDDYPYAGALFITRSLYSYEAVKKFSFMTEFILGIRGPASFARQTQEFIHSLINYQKPMGWGNQLTTSPLINLKFGAEKQLLAIGNFAEIIGGAGIAAGSYLDAFNLYPLLRIGKMAPYFDGLLNQFGSFSGHNKKSKSQFYLLFKPKSTWVLHNALMHGEHLHGDTADAVPPGPATIRRIRHRITDLQFGAVVGIGDFSVSYLQTHSTEYNSGLYHHNYGNISVYYKW
jgi:hypothetical protein